MKRGLTLWGRKYAVRVDLAYKRITDANPNAKARIVFVSGPFEDYFFWTERAQLRFIKWMTTNKGVPKDRLHLCELRWERIEWD